ncbi:Flp family type IVb pilin [Pandoraea pnomenusa]|uniref:Flp family type IVb pilin n=1 Tax=Pandoraea pnomenusa TaxID=93220 RepID=UPI003341FD99
MKLGNYIRLFVRDERGVTALEYGILAAVVAVIIGGTVYTNLGTTFTTLFSKVTSAIASVGA